MVGGVVKLGSRDYCFIRWMHSPNASVERGLDVGQYLCNVHALLRTPFMIQYYYCTCRRYSPVPLVSHSLLLLLSSTRLPAAAYFRTVLLCNMPIYYFLPSLPKYGIPLTTPHLVHARSSSPSSKICVSERSVMNILIEYHPISNSTCVARVTFLLNESARVSNETLETKLIELIH